MAIFSYGTNQPGPIFSFILCILLSCQINKALSYREALTHQAQG